MSRDSKARLEGGPPLDEIDGALAALGADELRVLVRSFWGRVPAELHDRLADAVIEHATRRSTFRPAGPRAALVAEVRRFAVDARRAGHTEADEINEYLHQAGRAFLAGDFSTTRDVLDPIFEVLADGMDLGQDELYEEVIPELDEAAGRYLVAAYSTSPMNERPAALARALERSRSVALVTRPLDAMEAVAVAALPELAEFLPRWVAWLETREREARTGNWSVDDDALREAVARSEGLAGLARIARASGESRDFREWCWTLTQDGQWVEALAAFGEAAERVKLGGAFLDGAVLAAMKLGRSDVAARLDAAWRAAPSAARLLRWLMAGEPEVGTLRRRAARALASSPTDARSLQGILEVLAGKSSEAAPRLATAPGLGWSHGGHPGHMLFAMFTYLLGDAPAGSLRAEVCGRWLPSASTPPTDPARCDDWPGLPTPALLQVAERAELAARLTVADRAAMRAAMRAAAVARTNRLTREQRRSHYPHAALLLATCVEVDVACGGEVEARAWVASVQRDNARYSALRAALGLALGRVRA